jgi:phosphate transport system substrate-binding protein
LSRPIFIYPTIAALERPEVQAFLDFHLTEGVPLVREVGYIALAPREYEMVRARLAARTAGSMYATPGDSKTTLEQRLSQ